MKTEDILIGAAILVLGFYGVNKFVKASTTSTEYTSTVSPLPFDATQKTIRTDTRQGNRTERASGRQKARTENVDTRQTQKTERASIRNDTYQTRSNNRTSVINNVIDSAENVASKVISAVSRSHEPNFSSMSSGAVYIAKPKTLRSSNLVNKVTNTLSGIKNKATSFIKSLRG